jgi:uncharacterized protein YqeY
MTLQEKLLEDLRKSLNNVGLRKCLRIIVGELQRQPKKILSDDEVIRILKKLEKSEIELLDLGGASTDRAFLAILNLYLPEETSGDEIKVWIKENIDFSKLRNKMQAVGMVMKHFGSSVDGGVVKKIVEEL